VKETIISLVLLLLLIAPGLAVAGIVVSEISGPLTGRVIAFVAIAFVVTRLVDLIGAYLLDI